jgi:hypothetical protein
MGTSKESSQDRAGVVLPCFQAKDNLVPNSPFLL